MGMDISSRSFIGLSVVSDDLFTTEVVKAYDHNYPSNYKVDPITGEKLWATKTVFKKGITDGGYTGLSIDKYDIYLLSDGSDNNGYVITLSKVETGSHRSGNTMAFKKGLPSQNEIDEFKKIMQLHDLWNENAFGIWVVTNFS